VVLVVKQCQIVLVILVDLVVAVDLFPVLVIRVEQDLVIHSPELLEQHLQMVGVMMVVLVYFHLVLWEEQEGEVVVPVDLGNLDLFQMVATVVLVCNFPQHLEILHQR
jgi:hypothetical protein